MNDPGVDWLRRQQRRLREQHTNQAKRGDLLAARETAGELFEVEQLLESIHHRYYTTHRQVGWRTFVRWMDS